MYKTLLLSGALLLCGYYISCSSEPIAPNKEKPIPPATNMPHPDTTNPILPDEKVFSQQEQVISKTVARLLSLKPAELRNKYVDLRTMDILNYNELLERIKDVQVIYVAEQHTNTEHHKLQENILKSLSKINPKTVLAMEFLYRSKQQACDDYISGQLPEEEFDIIVKEGFGSWYEQYYLQLIRYAKKSGLKLLALNVEKEIKRKMALNGWDKLTPEEQKLIAKDIDTSNKAHRAYVMRAFEGMNTKGIFNGPMGDRMYLLQAIWDETFGEAIANYLKVTNDPKAQIVVVLGSGHVSYKFTAPERAYKRYPAKYLTLIPVGIADYTPNKEEMLNELLSSGIGDFIYFAIPSEGE